MLLTHGGRIWRGSPRGIRIPWGVIGLGAIGAMVANAASALGMEVYGYDPYISIDAAWNLSRTIKHIKSLDEVYSQCDYITIHVPLMDATKKMINADAIRQMKDGVVILNFARDVLVDSEAMVDAASATAGSCVTIITHRPSSCASF